MPAVTRLLSVAAAGVAGALLLAACASVSNGDPTSSVAPTTAGSSTGSAPSTSTQTSPTSFPSSSDSSSGGGNGGLTASQALAALVTVGEVGAGFVDDTPTDDAPLPCTPNLPPLSQQYPAQVNVEKAYSAQNGAVYFSEQLETFADADTVAQVVTAGTQGLACSTATVNGTQVTIDGPQDLASKITTPVDQALAWSISQGSGAGQGVIAVQLGRHLVVLTFASSATANTDSLPDSAALTNAAIAKVAAAIP